jgi:hypothetical protein
MCQTGNEPIQNSLSVVCFALRSKPSDLILVESLSPPLLSAGFGSEAQTRSSIAAV